MENVHVYRTPDSQDRDERDAARIVGISIVLLFGLIFALQTIGS